MTSSAAATDAARRLWARVSGESNAPVDVAAAADRLFTQSGEGLSRWIGTEGYRTLHDRALRMARSEHPALDGLSCLGGDHAAIAATVRANGAAQMADGMVAWVAAMMDVLGRIIGEETAVRLVEETAVPSPRGVESTESEGGRVG